MALKFPASGAARHLLPQGEQDVSVHPAAYNPSTGSAPPPGGEMAPIGRGAPEGRLRADEDLR